MTQRYMFHGECLGCTRQEVESKGADFCVGCRFFSTDWDLPDLNNYKKTRAESKREEIKHRLGLA